MNRTLHTLALTGLLTCVAGTAQVAPGLRLVGSSFSGTTNLVDTNGFVVHTWSSPWNPGIAIHMHTDGTLYRTIRTPGSSIAGGQGGGVQRLDLDGNVLWDFRYDTGGNRAHHDIDVLPNGNVLMIAWERKTNAEAIAAGRNPAVLGTVFRPDHIIEVQPTGPTTGTIVWQWHVWDHLIQDFDASQANFGVVANHPELIDINFPGNNAPSNGDWNHMNSIEYVPEYDWIILSPRRQDEIWVIDHSTTTAEAAGHTGGMWGKGGDLLYRWGNPQAYDAGTPADQILEGQHSAQMIPAGYPGAGNVTIFNNRNGAPGQSEVLEIELPLDSMGNFILAPSGQYGPTAPVWSVSGVFGSATQSGAFRLPNGNTWITAANQNRLYEVDSAGAVLWQYNTTGTVFKSEYIDRTLWEDANELSIANGGTINFEMITGTPKMGDIYLMLGSSQGTSPGVVLDGIPTPLNVDGWFLMMLSNPNAFPFTDTAGTLDTFGRASASLSIPGGILPPIIAGLELNHAFVTLDAITMDIEFASNPVPMTFVP